MMLEYQRSLAEQLAQAGLSAEAVQVAKEVYDGAVELFGEGHPLVLRFLGTYGHALCRADRKEDAEPLFAAGRDRILRVPDSLNGEEVSGLIELVKQMQSCGFHQLADPAQERALDLLRSTPGVRTDFARNFLTSALIRFRQRGMPERVAAMQEQIDALPAGDHTRVPTADELAPLQD